MRFARRLLGISLVALLLQGSWTASRGTCVPLGGHVHGPHAMRVASANSVRAPGEMHHDCDGAMLGSGCGLMVGCAAQGLLTPVPALAVPHARPARVAAGAVAMRSIAPPQPLPPPPRD